MRTRYSPLSPLGRFLMALIFVLGGLGKIGAWSATLGYMAARGVPATAFFLACALVIELIGGLMLMFGLRPRLAAGVLFLYLIPVTLVMHGFWRAQGMEAQVQFTNFLKNLAIMGGLLAFATGGPAVARVAPSAEEAPPTARGAA